MFFGRRAERLPSFVRAGVVVHLDDGSAIAGVLLGVYDDVYSIAGARLLEETRSGDLAPTDVARAERLDGEILIERRRVRFVQGAVSVADLPDVGTRP
jgi:hypothetical protein